MNIQENESPVAASAGAAVANMALAHEMIMTDNFQLKPMSDMKDSNIVKHVHKIVHNAFWDSLQEEVTRDPPDFQNALKLLSEMKDIILDIIPPVNEKLKSNIQEVLDGDLIKQEVEHGVFNLESCAFYIINVLSKLCAPVRDKKIEELRQTKDLVPLLRGIFELLDLMKMDMVNFEIQSIKPVLMQQAVDYEKKKFDEYLKANPDGTANTKIWLKQAYEEIKSMHTTPTRNIRGVIITQAYLSLIDLEKKVIVPETLVLDELRIAKLALTYDTLIYVASILGLYNNYAGDHLTTDAEFMTQLKDTILIICGNTKCSDEVLLNIGEQVIQETDKQYEVRGIHKKSDDQKQMLKNQIKELSNKDNQFRNLVKSRIRDYLLLSFTAQARSYPTSSILLPIKIEVKQATDLFVRVIMHNRNVFHEIYNKILDEFFTSS